MKPSLSLMPSLIRLVDRLGLSQHIFGQNKTCREPPGQELCHRIDTMWLSDFLPGYAGVQDEEGSKDAK